MSFFNDFLGGIKTFGRTFAPMAGTVLGGLAGGPAGAGMGSQLGNAVSGWLGGGDDQQQGGVPQAPALSPNQIPQYAQGMINKYMPQGMQQTPFGQMGGYGGRQAGNWLGNKVSSWLPPSMQQQYGPQIQDRFSQWGQKAGNWGQQQFNNKFGSSIPQSIQRQTMGGMGGPMAREMKDAAYRRSAAGQQMQNDMRNQASKQRVQRQTAQENFGNMQEMPFGGGDAYSSSYDNYSPPQQQHQGRRGSVDQWGGNFDYPQEAPPSYQQAMSGRDSYEAPGRGYSPSGPDQFDYPEYAKGGHVRRPNLLEAVELMSAAG